MTSRVYRLHSTLELQLEDVHEFFDGYDLPVEIEDVDVTRRNNTLIVSAIAAEDNISKYTPTAQLKASVTENRLYETEDGWQETPPEDHESGSTGSDDGPQWGNFSDGAQVQEEEVEVNSKLVEYACFKGDRETVLQNTALQYPMFEVLCDLAKYADSGTLTAIATVDGELEAVRIVDGEQREASIEVVEDPRERDSENAVNWRDNEFISG
ncbi:uncharacterized protein NP_1390A [Natronomonas pharaonis DSM 2160]|uniref:Uncharacterized protein n=1 Tax=Natronomonas pharaonis (strain ATCC 35678 / DSM 2160 / CIP 103997 / JCM 8858 / NBRC 14720 / NCIMB 2260 / Gabara) TaxID=348780 RepID=A0A1U7EUW1_NATPD|nr:hypothetical protein [Natronomonas pharaonis]CAI48786.1 uncharacterized protein NP_1390A [Natronomonas pharaonis DSM 2160]